MKSAYKNSLCTFFIAFCAVSAFADDKSQNLLESRSDVNWITKEFKSTVSLDVDKAKIPIPSGKNTALNKINTRIPSLIKDPLLTLNVNSSQKLGDLVLNQEITYQELVQIMNSSRKTSGYFENDSSLLKTNHTIKLTQIAALFVKHKIPYTPAKSIHHISSKPYTGIIIDARGKLPVHGEYLNEKAQPCFFPRIFNEEMDVVYERNMIEPAKASSMGSCFYDFSDDERRYMDVSGSQPLHIIARESFGENRSDIVISNDDALKILTVPQNLELLKQGKIVILLDKDQLVHNVYAPVKDSAYYTTIKKIKLYSPTKVLGPDSVEDGPSGIKFIYNLKYVPDSPELLPGERERIIECASLLKEALAENSYTIYVAGHTADIGQVENQMELSIERTQTIIRELVKQGIPENLFSYRGFGATVPATGGDNSTEQGRALNRRVEITLRPRQTYVQVEN
ncbi:MAG: OmpA family protein [Treponema sp.]|nr:OmpA family protein [Treponema sp.]